MEQKAVSNTVASFQHSTENLGEDHKRRRCFKVWQAYLVQKKNIGMSISYMKAREKKMEK